MTAWWRRIPVGDALIAIATLVVMALGVLVLPEPRPVPWAGAMAVIADGRATPVHSPARLAGGIPATLRLVTAEAWPAHDVPVLVLRNLGSRTATLDIDGRRIGVAGPQVEQGDGEFQARGGYFRLAPGLPAGTVLVVGVNVGTPTAVYPELIGIAAAQAETLGRARFHTAVITILLTMAAASLVLHLATRTCIVLIFTTYTFVQAWYVAFATGEIATWPGLEGVQRFTYLGIMLSVAVAGSGAALFVRSLLGDLPRIQRPLKAIAWFLWGFGIIAICGVVGTVWPARQATTAALGNAIVLVWSIYLMLTTAIAARRGSRPALLLAIGWGPMWFATFARAEQFLRGGYSPFLDVLFPASMALAAVSMAVSIADQWRRQRQELYAARMDADTDGLTGVLNRRAIESRLRVACSETLGDRQGMAVLFIDLDHFKAINDRYGHAVGDICLQQAIQPIRAELRSGDLLGRWGGEEFVALLAGADLATAKAVAERIRRRLSDLTIPTAGGGVWLTASIGVAALGQGITTADDLVQAADAAVYRAKGQGRNRVEVALLPHRIEANR